jgi:hypothetical protein
VKDGGISLSKIVEKIERRRAAAAVHRTHNVVLEQYSRFRVLLAQGGCKMTYNPNEPDLRTTPQPYRRSSGNWTVWAGIIVVLLIAGFAWSQYGGHPGTDQTTTSSTTANPPAMAPATPATPAPALAPATPEPATPAPAK